MFCGNCGKEITDNAKFCPNCGNAISEEVAPAVKTDHAAKAGKKDKNFWIGAFVCAAAVILVVLAGSWLLKANKPEDVIKTYVEASFKPDAKAIWELLPKEVREAVLKEAEAELNLKGESEIIYYLNDILQDYIDRVDDQLEDGWNITYEVTNWDEYDQEDLLDLNRDYRQMGLTDFTADAARSATIEVTVHASEDETMTRKLYIKLIKKGRIWYLGGL